MPVILFKVHLNVLIFRHFIGLLIFFGEKELLHAYCDPYESPQIDQNAHN